MPRKACSASGNRELDAPLRRALHSGCGALLFKPGAFFAALPRKSCAYFHGMIHACPNERAMRFAERSRELFVKTTKLGKAGCEPGQSYA